MLSLIRENGVLRHIHTEVKSADPAYLYGFQILSLALILPSARLIVSIPATIWSLIHGNGFPPLITPYITPLHTLGIGRTVSFAIVTMVFAIYGIVILYFGAGPLFWRPCSPLTDMPANEKHPFIALGLATVLYAFIVEFQLVRGFALLLVVYVGSPIGLIFLNDLLARVLRIYYSEDSTHQTA